MTSFSFFCQKMPKTKITLISVVISNLCIIFLPDLYLIRELNINIKGIFFFLPCYLSMGYPVITFKTIKWCDVLQKPIFGHKWSLLTKVVTMRPKKFRSRKISNSKLPSVPQLPCKVFSPSDIWKKLSQPLLLHFPFGMGTYVHHTKY